MLAMHWCGDAFTAGAEGAQLRLLRAAHRAGLLAVGLHPGGDGRRGRAPGAGARLPARGRADGPARPAPQHPRRLHLACWPAPGWPSCEGSAGCADAASSCTRPRPAGRAHPAELPPALARNPVPGRDLGRQGPSQPAPRRPRPVFLSLYTASGSRLPVPPRRAATATPDRNAGDTPAAARPRADNRHEPPRHAAYRRSGRVKPHRGQRTVHGRQHEDQRDSAFINQGPERRGIGDTLDLAWDLLARVPWYASSGESASASSTAATGPPPKGTTAAGPYGSR